MQIRALLVGCGGVGAEYDLNRPDFVWTHAKAYSLTDGIELTVTDINAAKASKIAAVYGARIVAELSESSYKNFDLISLATPTPTHFEYLKKILPQSPSVIICEKPVVSSLKQADEIINIYQSSGSRVLVNYLRRFQPAYRILKERLRNDFHRSFLKEIIVKYKRGFLNNASHAVDLLEYLFDEPFDFENFRIQKKDFDSFQYDPTITGSCCFLNQPISFVGICNVGYPVFEIEMFYSNSKIIICDSGNEIRYYNGVDDGLKEIHDERQCYILDKYMLHVIQEATVLLNKGKGEDNFTRALTMNRRMLEIIEL